MSLQGAKTIQIRLMKAELFNPNLQDQQFNICIKSPNNQYLTPPFRIGERKLDLSSCPTLTLSIPKMPRSPLLSIIITSCIQSTMYHTDIDAKVIELIIMNGKKSNGNSQKHILAFPLFGKGQTVVGQLKVKVSLLDDSVVQHSRIISNIKNKSQIRKLVYSNSLRDDHFQPIYSSQISVVLPKIIQEDQKPQIQQTIKPITHVSTQLIKNELAEPFREQISMIQMMQCESRTNSQQQGSAQMQDLVRYQPITWRKEEEKDLADVPEDCRHLFLKISQINRRYAPLERIPSQQQFSECSDAPNNSRANSDLDSQEVSHPLQEVQQLLKQLNLYQFSQTLQVEQPTQP